MNEDVQRNTEMVKNNQNNIARLFDRRNDRVLAPPEKVKSSGNNNDRDDVVAMEEMNDNDNNNNNLKKREIASKRLAKRLALELKRHESGSSDDINENRKLDKNSKIHLHRSGSVTITSGGGSSNNNNNKMEEQKVVYDNNNNTQTPLDDELDSVLEQISQVHKLVNSTNQQFNVLQTKLNEADKLKLGKKKLKKRRGKKSARHQRTAYCSEFFIKFFQLVSCIDDIGGCLPDFSFCFYCFRIWKFGFFLLFGRTLSMSFRYENGSLDGL